MPGEIGPSPDWMQQAIRKVRGENPDMARTSIQPGGFISGPAMHGLNASGLTNPFTGNIYYDPSSYERMQPNERENALTHELMHSRQITDQSYLARLMNLGKQFFTSPEPYYERPNEMQAFQSERNRSLNLGLDMPDPVTGKRDIQLPSSTKRFGQKEMYPEVKRFDKELIRRK